MFGEAYVDFLIIIIGVQLLYNIVLVSTVQQIESAVRIHISPLFWISFSFRSPQSTGQSSLCYTVAHQSSILSIYYLLVIYFIHRINIVYTSIPISQILPPPRLFFSFVFIEVQLICNVSGIQQSDSVINIYILFQILFHHSLLYRIQFPVLYSKSLLVIYFIFFDF